MPNILNSSMVYKNQLVLQPLLADPTMFCRSTKYHIINLELYFSKKTKKLQDDFFIVFYLTLPTPPETCIDDSEEGVTINAREHLPSLILFSVVIVIFFIHIRYYY